MRRDTQWVVEADDDGIRPAGPSDECFYCQVKAGVGLEHKQDCVIRQRTVVVRAYIDYVVRVPEDWTPDHIRFHRNEGSWCANNGLAEVDRVLRHRYEVAGYPLPVDGNTWVLDTIEDVDPCDFLGYEYQHEATADEEKRDGVVVPSTTSTAALGQPEQMAEDDAVRRMLHRGTN